MRSPGLEGIVRKLRSLDDRLELKDVPQDLRLRWAATGLAGALVLFGAWTQLAGAWDTGSSERWLLQSGLVWLYLWIVLLRALPRNRLADSGPILASWGPGTWLSLLRALAISGLAGFLLQPRPAGALAWLPMILYTSSDVADYFDGYLARRSGYTTRLGEDLDMELDALGLLIAVTLAAHYGVLPWLFLPVGLARYGFAAMVAIRRRRGLPVEELPASVSRRPIAGMTMGFISATLWPIVSRPEATLAAVAFFTPFAASFLRDGLVVATVIDPAGERYRRARQRLKRLLLDFLPMLARAAFVIAAPLEIGRLLGQPGAPGMIFELTALAGAVPLTFGLIEALGGMALFLGWAGRLAAFGLLFPIGLTIAAQGLDWTRAVMLFSVLIVLIAGSGRLSLWKPSEVWFRRRAGE